MKYKVGDTVYYDNEKYIIEEVWGEASLSPSANLLIKNCNDRTAVHENQLDICNIDCKEYNQYSVLCQCCGFPYRISCCKKI